MEDNKKQANDTIIYAGFWRRVIAYFIDAMIIFIIMLFIYSAAGALTGNNQRDTLHIGDDSIQIILDVVAVIVVLLYYALLEASPLQATVGKRMLGVKVTGMDLQRIGLKQSLFRNVCKVFSAIILCIGFIMAGVTSKKQALHDKMAKCLVVDNLPD